MSYWRSQPILVPGDRAENRLHKASGPKEQTGWLQNVLNVIGTKEVANRLQRGRSQGQVGHPLLLILKDDNRSKNSMVKRSQPLEELEREYSRQRKEMLRKTWGVQNSLTSSGKRKSVQHSGHGECGIRKVWGSSGKWSGIHNAVTGKSKIRYQSSLGIIRRGKEKPKDTQKTKAEDHFTKETSSKIRVICNSLPNPVGEGLRAKKLQRSGLRSEWKFKKYKRWVLRTSKNLHREGKILCGFNREWWRFVLSF